MLPIISLICGVARCSKLIAAMNAAAHKNNERNSLVKPLENEISHEAMSTMIINQSAKFKTKAST